MADEDEEPLPLTEIRRWWVSSVSSETEGGDGDDYLYEWLKKAEKEEAKWENELENNPYKNSARLFETESDSDGGGGGGGSRSKKNAKTKKRVLEWSSSSLNPDGIVGEDHQGFQRKKDIERDSNSDSVSATSPTTIKIVYVLSDKCWEGFGDQVWASSRRMANLLADPEKCRKLILNPATEADPLNQQQQQQHPLLGKNFVELGAGAAIPSWIAARCGANVVCTDQKLPFRFRSIAESAERNWRDIIKTTTKSSSNDDDVGASLPPVRACPYDWGDPIDQVAHSVPNGRKFDVVVAADCCYMPWLHSKLLDSIDMLLSTGNDDNGGGVALVSFALHGNVRDDEVWGIVDTARDKGFQVDILDSEQLTPQKAAMEPKQALVHMLRLTRKR